MVSLRARSLAPSIIKPAPRPPLAPLPGAFEMSLLSVSCATWAKRSNASESKSTCSGVAPFWGPYTRATPLGPQRTFLMLHTASICTVSAIKPSGELLQGTGCTYRHLYAGEDEH